LISVQHFVPGLRGKLTRRTRDPPSREEEGAKVLLRQQPLRAVGGSVDKKKKPKKQKKKPKNTDTRLSAGGERERKEVMRELKFTFCWE